MLTAAIAMYRAAGFREIPAYYDTPIEGTVFLELGLQPLSLRA
jgi:ribosomal protein S18 acetylase RimI-like enzyme